MRILHLSSPKNWRGGEQQVAYLREELARLRVDDQLILCRKNSQMQAYCEARSWPYATWSKLAGVDPFAARKLARVAKEFKADLIHIHDAASHTQCVLAWDLWGMKVPAVMSRRVDFPVKNSSFSHYKYNHSGIKRFLCISKTVARVLKPSLKHPELIRLVPSGIDLGKFKQAPASTRILRDSFPIDDDQHLIANIAAITPQKDYNTFVRTVNHLKELPAHFLIIGDGKQRREIEDEIRKMNLGAHISFTGFRNDIPDILPELDCLLFTSETEGLGTTIIDALATGVPIVSTNAGGIPEIIENGVHALVAPVKDDKALADAVLKMMSSSELRRKLTASGKTRARDFDKSMTAKLSLEVYKELLD